MTRTDWEYSQHTNDTGETDNLAETGADIHTNWCLDILTAAADEMDGTSLEDFDALVRGFNLGGLLDLDHPVVSELRRRVQANEASWNARQEVAA